MAGGASCSWSECTVDSGGACRPARRSSRAAPTPAPAPASAIHEKDFAAPRLALHARQGRAGAQQRAAQGGRHDGRLLRAVAGGGGGLGLGRQRGVADKDVLRGMGRECWARRYLPKRLPSLTERCCVVPACRHTAVSAHPLTHCSWPTDLSPPASAQRHNFLSLIECLRCGPAPRQPCRPAPAHPGAGSRRRAPPQPCARETPAGQDRAEHGRWGQIRSEGMCPHEPPTVLAAWAQPLMQPPSPCRQTEQLLRGLTVRSWWAAASSAAAVRLDSTTSSPSSRNWRASERPNPRLLPVMTTCACNKHGQGRGGREGRVNRKGCNSLQWARHGARRWWWQGLWSSGPASWPEIEAGSGRAAAVVAGLQVAPAHVHADSRCCAAPAQPEGCPKEQQQRRGGQQHAGRELYRELHGHSVRCREKAHAKRRSAVFVLSLLPLGFHPRPSRCADL